jgi:hypothetical protein
MGSGSYYVPAGSLGDDGFLYREDALGSAVGNTHAVRHGLTPTP